MASTVSTAVIAAASELLQQDAQPLLDAFIADIQTAGNALVAKLPVGAQPLAGVGASLLTSLAAVAAQAELGVILAHNPAPALPAAPSPTPAA